MKSLNSSFLYFLSIFGLICFSLNHCYGQEKNDSLNYYYSLVTSPKNSSDLPLAYNFYERHKKNSLLEKDTLSAIYALRFMATIQKDLGYFYDSEASAIEGLELLDQLNNNTISIGSKLGMYNHLGIIYKLSNNYNKAHQFYDKALLIVEKVEDSIAILNNKANVLIVEKKYNEAINILLDAYSKSVNTNNEIQKARILDNLGVAQYKSNNDEALSNIEKALSIRLKHNNIKGIYTSYRNLSKYYYENKNSIKSKSYANKAYSLARQINSTSYIEDALSTLIALKTDTIISDYKHLKDSIFKARELSRNAYAFNKYNYEKRERELLKVQHRRTQEKTIYFSIAIILVIISLFMIYTIKQGHKKEKLKQIYLTETRISKRVHDELANDVYHVMNYIQSNKQQPEVLSQLENIYKRTRDISYENSSVNLNKFHDELKEMIISYQSGMVGITIINLTTTFFNTIKDYKKIVLERVLRELLINMKKHSKASQVVISFKKDINNLYINYSDNGIGIDPSTSFKNNGLQNAENRINSINGNFKFDFNRKKGVGIEIIIPIKN